MAKTNMLEFNIKNVKFAVKNDLGTYDTPKDLAYAESIAFTPTFNETTLYGDGKAMATIASDKGFTGTLIFVQPSEAYEIAMKRKIQTANGLADITQIDNIEHAIYYEIDYFENGKVGTKKVWLLNMTTGRPSESYTQTKEEATINNVEYPFTIMGDIVKTADGNKPYIDDMGNQLTMTRIISSPSDTGYATFGDAVPEATYGG